MYFQGKVILVTGGTGSMGKTFVRRVLSGELGVPKKLIVLSRDESKQHEMRVSYLHAAYSTDEVIYRNFLNVLEFRIGDVRDYADVVSAMRGVDIVVNAAALKQVPTCEYFPAQAVMTNCMGAMNIVRAAGENGSTVHTVIGISTDKACKPVNAMGMTKAIQERIFISANILNPKTRFLCVRYGNVLASRGSVIPLFHEQIKNGGPVTITDTKMTRFLLTLNQAVDTVFTALQHGEAGEIFIPRVPASNMADIARALIGDRKIETKITGIRPGEKMYEILVSDEEALYVVERAGFYVIRSMLPELTPQPDKSAVLILKKEYSSADDVLDYAGTLKLLTKNNLLDIHAHGGHVKEELLR
ncbi:MAG: polysaccharide biosynthesis protein [Bdellovibrionaceae bacterium]|nr:polysaccharide biosynthesis protein [Pseudobdellovibrionaceae bacterium]